MPNMKGMMRSLSAEIDRLEDKMDPDGAGMRALVRAVAAEDKRFNVWWRRAFRWLTKAA